MRIDGDISNKLEEHIDCLTKHGIKNLLIVALDEMQSYNGQSITSAICRAMGAEESTDNNGLPRWILPTKAKLRREFN